MELVKPEPLIEEPDITGVYKMYEEFHTVYQIGINRTVQELYAKLIEEEHEEWLEEYFGFDSREYNELKELADLLYVTLGLAYTLNYKLTKAKKFNIPEYYDYSITDFVSEIAVGKQDKTLLSNLIYCIYGYAISMGWDLNEAFKRVHESNMSKVDNNGKPIFNASGKVMKGPNYKPPCLKDLTNGQ
jgi:hypothetical protein